MDIDAINDDVISYRYAPFYAERDPRNVVNIDPTEGHGIFTSGMTECVSFAFIMKKNNEIKRLSMIHFPGGITSYALDSEEGKEILKAMVANAPKDAEIEAVIGLSSSHYPNGLFDDQEILEVLNKQVTELGFQLTDLQLCAGNGRNLDESGFSFGVNFNGEYGEFVNCHGLRAKGMWDSKEACVNYDDTPLILSQLTYLLHLARLRGDKQRWETLQEDIKRLEGIHTDKDFSQVKAMPFKLEQQDLPLDNPAQLKDMLLRVREGNNKELWQQIKTTIVQTIEQSSDKSASLVKYKSILQLHLDKNASHQYVGSFFSRTFQKGEPTHWRQVKKYDSPAETAQSDQDSSIDSESSDSDPFHGPKA